MEKGRRKTLIMDFNLLLMVIYVRMYIRKRSWHLCAYLCSTLSS